MIQELFGVVEDRKFPNISGGLLGVPNEPAVASSCSPAHSTTSSSTSSAAASTTTSSSTSNGAEQQHLRCPRCDSTNTKFCYYNNYNLTQPRHFCKTCRRYWTQGGALRNVPIGGGCRKTKSTGISLGGAAKSGNSGTTGIKAKPQASSDLAGVINGKSAGFGGAMGFVDHELPSSPILWAAPQNSHLLSLLRAAQISSGVSNTNTSSNPNPNPIRGNMTNIYTNHPARVVKEEGPMAAGSHLVPEASLLINALNARNLGLDPLGQQVPLGLCNSLWRSSPQYLQHPLQHQQQHQQQPLVPGLQQQQQQQQQQQNNIGMLQSSDQIPSSAGIQELIQRLRSTNNVHHYTDHQAPQLVQLGNGCPASSSSSSSPAISFSTSTTAAISEPAAPVAGGDQFGCWINTSTATTPFAWADMPNINGAFP